MHEERLWRERRLRSVASGDQPRNCGVEFRGIRGAEAHERRAVLPRLRLREPWQGEGEEADVRVAAVLRHRGLDERRRRRRALHPVQEALHKRAHDRGCGGGGLLDEREHRARVGGRDTADLLRRLERRGLQQPPRQLGARSEPPNAAQGHPRGMAGPTPEGQRIHARVQRVRVYPLAARVQRRWQTSLQLSRTRAVCVRKASPEASGRLCDCKRPHTNGESTHSAAGVSLVCDTALTTYPSEHRAQALGPS